MGRSSRNRAKKIAEGTIADRRRSQSRNAANDPFGPGPARPKRTLSFAELSDFSYEFPGSSSTSTRAVIWPQEQLEALMKTLGVSRTYDMKPRLRHLLISSFEHAHEQRRHYDAKEETVDMQDAFFARVVSGVAADAAKSIDLRDIEAGTLRSLVELYVATRKEFRMRQEPQEKLVHRKAKAEKADDDDEDMGGTGSKEPVVEEGYPDDEDDLFLYQTTEYMYDPAREDNKNNRLVKLVDRWIQWLEVEKGQAVDPGVFEALAAF
ncbi:Uu.00g016190.m01.CDS01 [Anthostomella pinea]|uniref:Uu.00g016190.m01.CDS01 n=1 Tax=Anthostomella pinea TaxID=933095 RepID=A0AAI8VZK0_9PEZI|nr:Uu.00g016190.m01.CDS01 [Anthostomella pinea]